MASNQLIDVNKVGHAIREGMRSLAITTGFEDSPKGHRDFALVLQAAISLSFLHGDKDMLEGIAMKLIPLSPGLKDRLKRPSVTGSNS